MQNAEAAALHGADIKDMLDQPMSGAAGFKINVIGPKADLEKMRPKLEPRWVV